MIFLDSWVWLEYLFSGEGADEAESIIQKANSPDEGGLIASTVVAEVSYRVHSVEDEDTAEQAVRALSEYEYIRNQPLFSGNAHYAASLRYKYYQPGECELSYADAIHLATAAMEDECHTLYSGDPDFEDVDEIDTVIL